MTGMKMRLDVETWRCDPPFRISGYVFESIELLVVTLTQGGKTGRAEASGVYYRGETARSMAATLEGLRGVIEQGITRQVLQRALPAGGARHALDCALWDLEARLSGVPVWQLAGLEEPRPLLTTFTCGVGSPEEMAARARRYGEARALKLKLTGDAVDAARVRAVREARPDIWLGVDANQGLTRAALERLMPALVECGVALIEQPFPVGSDAWLDGLRSPIRIAADESVQTSADIAGLAGRVDVINIKLDKAGGLTEGLAMATAARAHGLEVMVGCMVGTSLGMAPAYLLGQHCTVVDLDGPVLLAADRSPACSYAGGMIAAPDALWGGA